MTKAHVMQMNSGYLNDGREILRYASVATASDTYSHVAPGSRRPLLTRLSRCWNQRLAESQRAIREMNMRRPGLEPVGLASRIGKAEDTLCL
jgi:hypothetical protein